MLTRLAFLFNRLMLTNWSDEQSKVDAGQTTPDLTMPFIILACALIAGLTIYVIVRVWLHAKHEREVLERGMRAALPHIKSLDNTLPANSLNSLHSNDKEKESKKARHRDDYAEDDE